MTNNQPQYVVVRKARGSKGIFREVLTEPAPFETATQECEGENVMMRENDISIYVAPYNGKRIGEDY
jgi:hypothetical protein